MLDQMALYNIKHDHLLSENSLSKQTDLSQQPSAVVAMEFLWRCALLSDCALLFLY